MRNGGSVSFLNFEKYKESTSMPAGMVAQIGKVTTGLLNTVNDVAPGQSVVSGTGANRFTGQLGQRVALGPDEVRFDSSIGTLFGGIYQYVRLAVGSAAIVRGQILFWDTSVAENLYQVTATEPTGVSLIAGIALNVITPGNFGFIQIAGRASVKARAALTKAGAIGDYMIAAGVGGADTGFSDTIADATGLTPVLARRFIGIAEGAPANGAIGVVRLKGNDWHI